MKRNTLLSLLAGLFLAACTFDAPLAPYASTPIDPELLGTWEPLPVDDATPTGEITIVKRADENRYLIEHRDGDSILYFDAWLGRQEGITFLQLEVTGDEDGPATPDDTDLFSVVSYSISGDELVMHSLNTDLIDENLADTPALQKAFFEHREHPELFVEPSRMRRR